MGRVSAGLATATPAGQGPLRQWGVNYDVGTVWAGYDSRLIWTDMVMRRELDAIVDDLHCSAILIHGTDTSRLLEAADYAVSRGLTVWLQPRLMNATQADVLANISDAATAATTLKPAPGVIGLNIGVEASLFTTDIIPGGTYESRVEYLTRHLDELPVIHERLNEFLALGAKAAAAFDGPLTYSSGPWERVDWSAFTHAGLDHYWNAGNADTYVDRLRQLIGNAGKPVIITEFGCCTFEGAEDLGGTGYEVIDYASDTPTIAGDLVRSEQTQADEILRLLSIFESEGVDGAFVYQFIDQGTPHSVDPTHDLDMGSFGIVKTFAPGTPGKADDVAYWEPKEAFDHLAMRFASYF